MQKTSIGRTVPIAHAPLVTRWAKYVRTGDTHYADVARLLLYDTKQAADIHGSLGYGHSGLCTEVLSLSPPRGHGVNTWLPWLTYSLIEPIVRLREAFGKMDTPIVWPTEMEFLRAKDAEHGRTQGMVPASA